MVHYRSRFAKVITKSLLTSVNDRNVYIPSYANIDEHRLALSVYLALDGSRRKNRLSVWSEETVVYKQRETALSGRAKLLSNGEQGNNDDLV